MDFANEYNVRERRGRKKKRENEREKEQDLERALPMTTMRTEALPATDWW